MRCGGIVLCGGRSSRMGVPKYTLPFGPETMLARVVRLVASVVEPIVVVAAPEQQVPPLDVSAIVARDRREGRGPLEGLAAGLAALPVGVEAAYVTSCDVPLLAPALVTRMCEWAEGYDAAVPVERAGDRVFHHPLAAVYRAGVAVAVESLLAADRLRPVYLYEAVRTRLVEVDELRAIDPELATLANLNRPADYLAALARAGFACPPEVAALLHAAEA